MNCLTVAIKRFCVVLGVLSFCLFIAKTTIAQVHQEDMTYSNETAYAEGVQSQDGFFEDFDRGRADNWVDDESGAWSVTDKVYRMNGTGAGVLRASCYNVPFDDFAYQIDTRRAQGNLNASQGMVFRLSGNGDFYIFAIAASGYYSAFKFDARTGIELIPWTTTPVIKKGANAWNTMKVVCHGSDIDFFINGTLLKTVKDSAAYLSGMVGVFAVDEAQSDQGSPIVDFDNIRLSISGSLSNYETGSVFCPVLEDLPLN